MIYKHILVPTDGSELSQQAVKAAIDFARDSGARITGFTAVPEYQVPSEADVIAHRVVSIEQHEQNSKKLAERLLAPVAEAARAAGVKCGTDFAQSNLPFKAIIEAAGKHGCDLIFMASHGRRGIAGLLLGSETVKVLTHSKIPALVHR